MPEEYKDDKDGRVSLRRLVRKGIPYIEIIKLARDEGVDLIITGSCGRSGVKSMLIGSVAEKVVRNAPCPVLTVRGFKCSKN